MGVFLSNVNPLDRVVGVIREDPDPRCFKAPRQANSPPGDGGVSRHLRGLPRPLDLGLGLRVVPASSEAPRRLLIRIEEGTANLLGRRLSGLPVKLRASLVQAALVFGGIAVGVLINKEIAWILLAVVLTVLIMVAIGGAYARQPSREPEANPTTATAGEQTSRVVRLGSQQEVPTRPEATPEMEELGNELTRSLAAVRGPSNELQEWLDHERERGADFLQSIRLERAALLQSMSQPGVLTRFGAGIRLRTLETNIGLWDREIESRLTKELSSEAATLFRGVPRPIKGDPTSGDLDRLESHVRDHLRAITELLG
jgi:hypothetical protein